MNRELISLANSLIGLFKKEGLKVTRPFSLGECVEIGIDLKDLTFFLYIFRGTTKKNIVIKMITSPRSCQEALLDPKGLFIIDNNLEMLVNKIFSKIGRLKRISRIIKV